MKVYAAQLRISRQLRDSVRAEHPPAAGLCLIGDNGVVAADDDRTGTFRGATFTGADFTGATFRDCDLRHVKITDSWLVDVRVSGLVGNFVVNDVDVTAFVEGNSTGGTPNACR